MGSNRLFYKAPAGPSTETVMEFEVSIRPAHLERGFRVTP
jgi:hypothetical protein